MDKLLIYTIYDRPTDYPNEYVGRIHEVVPGVSMPGRVFARGRTLEDIRNKLPAGLHCLGRESSDEPQIVESWV